jgi:DNA-binding transcriptional MerR regulator
MIDLFYYTIYGCGTSRIWVNVALSTLRRKKGWAVETNPSQSFEGNRNGETRQVGDPSQGQKLAQDQDAKRRAGCDAQAAERVFTIGDMAREFGVSLRALRFYEDRGLLHPRRRGTARLYCGRDRLHLRMILKGKQLGFTLTEIHDILVSRESPIEGADLELSLHPDQIAAQIRHLERQRADLDAALVELRHAHERAAENAHCTAA